MDPRFVFYPWDCQDIIRTMTNNHWFIRGYHLLSRRPTRAELLMPHPPFGLIRDADYWEEIHLEEFLRRRQARRAAEAAGSYIRVPFVVPSVRMDVDHSRSPSAGPALPAPPEREASVGPDSSNDDASIGEPSPWSSQVRRLLMLSLFCLSHKKTLGTLSLEPVPSMLSI
jgi:hypothetical protein